MKNFNGKILFLDRSDINTDEIIPARYLTELTKEALKPFCLEDLRLPGFDPSTDIEGKTAIITRENFGTGSSREHAPWALEENGINIVVAANFARIFRQNMFNNGMMAIELAKEEIDKIFDTFANTETELKVDFDKQELTVFNDKDSFTASYTLGDFYKELVKVGGWIEYVDRHY